MYTDFTLTTTDVAESCAMHPNTVRNKSIAGTIGIAFIIDNGKRLYSEQSLAEWHLRREQGDVPKKLIITHRIK